VTEVEEEVEVEVVVDVVEDSSDKLCAIHSVDPGVFSVSSATAKSPNFLLVSSIRRSINKLGSTTVLLQPGAGGGVMVSSTSATTDLEKPISSSADRKVDSFIVKRPESVLILGSLERFGLEVALVSRGL